MSSATPRPVVHVVGARPNLVKAAPVIAALRRRGVSQLLIHTGQHRDPAMSEFLFRDLGMATADVELRTPSSSATRQLAGIMNQLEPELARLVPPLVVVYGDVRSTLAAALVAAQLQIPIAHVEAGLRSFDMSMPEEMNRRIVDVLAALHFATLPEALANLSAEGIPPSGVHQVGNPMIDSLLANRHRLDARAIGRRYELPLRYAVATFHRPSNVDQPRDAEQIVAALGEVSREIPVVLPLHPRGRRTLRTAGLMRQRSVFVLPPLGYLDFLSLVSGAAAVVTDSGGVQEETTALRIPCLTVRANTERPSTVTLGTNQLVRPGDVGRVLRDVLGEHPKPRPGRIPLWDGRAGERIAAILAAWLKGASG